MIKIIDLFLGCVVPGCGSSVKISKITLKQKTEPRIIFSVGIPCEGKIFV